ncbi:hypothetical protein HPB48_025552 [Haemaphysalis longicornis]|uniref:Potassium channel domain-containing protein n=1 Tax=Haemaphysalis longicornis TaxID=44386 RepID=A0A9J6H7U4_HAELO|nr:hypothetical protein HPB48_025552 [Haemaphysalis longicornis]
MLGYGNIAPKTAPGKVVTILYAIVGIPLMLLCLSNIGNILAHAFKFFYANVCCLVCRKADAAAAKVRSPSRCDPVVYGLHVHSLNGLLWQKDYSVE